ncbi:class I SAM-dependent methyltransferase [Jidongwangia harbinensis]|uniref:class I SAM-dependent methyltransferase n=1 Tax=Jidongwangia harbinensis TaxID=2878561 RepID=UPI001CDA37AF|nr:class I SAM-dependent methyltransferase [Jidongwangia harbinensis]MCA2216596.1 class I SAM-dependent methyltransferase [Jidongwangia harbinensis]
MAESFGTDPERYDRARPRYPDALVARVAAAGREVLDVGCGTGIAARQFQAAGCTVLGIDPDPRMTEFADRTGVPVEVATFESWEPAGRTFDVVVAGTAWHWVDPVAGPAKAAQVLRPGGRLAAFWHAVDPPPDVTDAFTAVYRQVLPDLPFPIGPRSHGADAYQPLFTRAADGMRGTGAFGEPEQWRFDSARTYTRDEWLDQLPTSGALTRLAPDRLAELLNGIGSAIDALGGRFTTAQATVAVTAVRA